MRTHYSIFAAVALVGCVFEARLADAPTGSAEDSSEQSTTPIDLSQASYSPQHAQQAARIVAESLCQRTYTDCAWLCTNAVECAATRAACIDVQAQEIIHALDYPVGSVEVARACGERVSHASNCPEMTFAYETDVLCGQAVINGCTPDNDGLGHPYSWLGPASVETLPVNMNLKLCAGVAEWLLVHLNAGETLSIAAQGLAFTTSITANLYVSRGSNQIESLQTVFVNSTPAVFTAAPSTRSYYVSLETTWNPISTNLRLCVNGFCAD